LMESPSVSAEQGQIELVRTLERSRMIRTSAVRNAFLSVPRHLFLPHVGLDEAYSDRSISLKAAAGFMISSSSQPSIMAEMLEQLGARQGHHALEIGTASGFNAGLIAQIVGQPGEVVSVEIEEDLATSARTALRAAGIRNVEVISGDGGLGYEPAAPYDRIIVTVASWDITPGWWDQLGPNGRIVLPLVLKGGQQISVAFDRIGDHLESSSVKPCGFMLMRGDFAAALPIPLGPTPGLVIIFDGNLPADPDDIYRWLNSTPEQESAGIRISPIEGRALVLWLGRHRNEFCRLVASGDRAGWAPIPEVTPQPPSNTQMRLANLFRLSLST
jgi:protein-L-isoaspartate(D-aspartate) O-methyltransferase